MKFRKIISFFIVLTILLYTLLALVPMNNQVYAGTLSDDIDGIDEAKYPGYKQLINDLKNKYPAGTYNFKLFYTGIDWNTAVTVEYQGHKGSPLNLFNIGTNYTGKWYCPICGTQKFDNGSLCCASKEAISYMLDPRNSINEASIFQFKSLEEPDVEIEDLNRIVQGTFLANAECVQAIYDASRTYNINGYFLVAKMINEHGKSGSALSNGNGTGYYNYFNIGSFGNSASAIIQNGLNFAKNAGWNSPRASILGGTEIVKNSYINERGQNTLYFQKFNLVGKSGLGTYQYQQNIMAAENQGRSLKGYYNTSTKTNVHTFVIPVYENMPNNACPRPNTSVSSTLTYEEGNVTNVSSSLAVRIAPSRSAKEVGRLNNGESIKILERAQVEVDGYFWDLIVSNLDGTYGYAARIIGGDNCLTGTGQIQTITVDSPNTPENPTVPENPEPLPPYTGPDVKISGANMETVPNATVDSILKTNPTAIVKDKNGVILSNEKSLGTGYTVTIDGASYVIVKKGDVNGDAAVNIQDVVGILNHLKGRIKITDPAELEAAKVKKNQEESIQDVVEILNHLKGRINIGL